MFNRQLTNRPTVVAGILAVLLTAICQADLRDPTRPPGYRMAGDRQKSEPDQSDRLQLSGIISGPGGNSAVINGRRLRPGSSIAGARVLAVTPKSVKIERNGNRFTMQLLPTLVKTPVARRAGGAK